MEVMSFCEKSGPGLLRGRTLTGFARLAAPLVFGMVLALAVTVSLVGAQDVSCPDPADPCAGNQVDVQPGEFPRITWIPTDQSLTTSMPAHARAFAGVTGSNGQDSTVSGTITLDWVRDLDLEQQLLADTAGGGFGGYNIYRVFTTRDTCRLELIRRFVYEDTLLWHWDDTDTLLSFVDPDSAGNLVKICRPAIDPDTGEPIPQTCPRPGDSTFVLLPPPPPPDGFPTYYTIIYAADPSLIQGGFENLFVPDTTACANPMDETTCCNINNLALNLMSVPVFTTGPTTSNLEQVIVVPNPYEGRSPWDPPGQGFVEFRNLPRQAEIKIYTAAGDLVAKLQHDDPKSGSRAWNLRNQNGQDVASGIYMYRVTSPPTVANQNGFNFSSHFVIVR
jgi:hypothetical protein